MGRRFVYSRSSRSAIQAIAAGKEPSITNVIPYEDLVRQICDWISYQIAGKTPPTDDAEFEIEAKLGAIVDRDTKERVRLPVSSEAILDTTQLGQIQFASTMDEVGALIVFRFDILTT